MVFADWSIESPNPMRIERGQTVNGATDFLSTRIEQTERDINRLESAIQIVRNDPRNMISTADTRNLPVQNRYGRLLVRRKNRIFRTFRMLLNREGAHQGADDYDEKNCIGDFYILNRSHFSQKNNYCHATYL